MMTPPDDLPPAWHLIHCLVGPGKAYSSFSELAAASGVPKSNISRMRQGMVFGLETWTSIVKVCPAEIQPAACHLLLQVFPWASTLCQLLQLTSTEALAALQRPGLSNPDAREALSLLPAHPEICRAVETVLVSLLPKLKTETA